MAIVTVLTVVVATVGDREENVRRHDALIAAAAVAWRLGAS